MNEIKDCAQHTFLICAYSESPFLENCILSILNQTLKSNIIVSTSTITEKTRELATKYNIKLYEHNKGGCIGKDWNAAIAISNTQFITITHQDDIYLPNFLDETMNLFYSNKDNSIIAFSNYKEIDEKGLIIKRNLNLKIKDLMLFALNLFPESVKWRKFILSWGSPICCPAVTYNMECIKNFKFSEEISATVDWEAFYRISEIKGKWLYSSNKNVLHRIHNASETTNAINTNARSQEEFNMFIKFWPKYIAKIINKLYSYAQKTNG